MTTAPTSPRTHHVTLPVFDAEELTGAQSKKGFQGGRPKVGLLCKQTLGADDFHISAADERASGAGKEALRMSSARYAAAKGKASETGQRAQESILRKEEILAGMELVSFPPEGLLRRCLSAKTLEDYTDPRHDLTTQLNDSIARIFADTVTPFTPEAIGPRVVSAIDQVSRDLGFPESSPLGGASNAIDAAMGLTAVLLECAKQ